MTRPKTFTHLGKDWKILYRRKETDGKGCVGLTDWHKCEIEIFTKGHTAENIKDTLLHELLHVVFREIIKSSYTKTKAKESEDMEESIVSLATPQLLTLFKTNSKLVNYLFK